ncbi:MAG: GNAT family N-acetyltransferase [Paracoccaceae bacterium]|nr:GNAT family N-acetyltransferase [Paracoccaceae bacterium]
MVIDQFNTERLQVLDWRALLDDEEARPILERALSEILTPPVLENLPEVLQPDTGADGISRWIDARAAESDVMLVTEIESGAHIGLLILAPDPHSDDADTLHIGYFFSEKAWKKGFATELVMGLVSELDAREPVALVGGVGKGNLASSHVLRKAGFWKDHDLSSEDTDFFVRYPP